MLWNNSSFFNQDRGKSMGGKMANPRIPRYIQPKFLSKISQNNDPQKEKNQPLKLVVKKENIAPQEIKSTMKKTGFQSFNKPQFNKTAISVFQKTDKIEKNTLIFCNLRGLHNIGNTCYMNSTLQCLFHLPYFNTQFQKQFKKKGKGNVSEQYYNLLGQLSSSTSESAINPVDYKKSIGRKKPRFLGSSQQDAQQFLTTFLELVNEELTRVQNKPKYKELQNDPSKKPISQLSEEWWSYYLARDNSIICDIFQGQIISTVKCRKCEQQSVTFDNLWGISVAISKGRSVSELLTKNWQGQSLIDDYHCSKCKKTRICSKTLDFFRAPQVLVIQLKRFEYGKYSKRKKNDQVIIDEQLNMNRLISDHSSQKNTAPIYKLQGIIHHFGDTDFGHYTATIRSHKKNKWYEMNDSRYEEANFNKYTKTGYLLFYEKSR